MHYLCLIDQIDLLPRLFGMVSVPQAVRDELDHTGTPAAVRSLVRGSPGWLTGQAALPDPEPVPLSIDTGKRAVIQLARAAHADLLLMDDRAAVAAARARGFAVTGTLVLLEQGARLRLLDLAAAFDRLRGTNFHVAEALLERLLREQSSGQAG